MVLIASAEHLPALQQRPEFADAQAFSDADALRAPRFKIVDGVDVMIDGNPAMLMDLSVIGAMVVSPTTLKPNQRVRMSLPQEPRAIRFSAGVAWAAFEMPKGKPAPHYKAGIEFFDADADAVLKFIDTKKSKK
jgi:hypothetical protein